MTVQPTIVIAGCGFGGIALGILLKRAGIESFTILERADDVGGVWRDNHYPGAACDVPASLYSYSFEPNSEWTRMFAEQSEIRDYLRRCAVKYGIVPPTLNLHNPSTGCDINLVAHTAQERPVKRALSNSFGFGGTNASLIFAEVN